MIDDADNKTIDVIDYINKQKYQTVGYIRVSSEDQNTDRQLDGIALDKIFIEKVSGSKKNRPQLSSMIDYVRQGDVVVVHSLDRLARDLSNLLNIIETLNKKGVSLKSMKENLTFNSDSNNPLDKFLLHILGAVAEFQRSLIKEAQAEGIKKAQERGAFKGRKPKLSDDQIEKLRHLSSLKHTSVEEWKNISWNDIAKEFNVTKQTIYNYLKRL